MSAKSKHSLNGPIIKIRRGLAIYRTNASPYYYARVRTPKGTHVVRSTKETSRINARAAAEELASAILTKAGPVVPTNLTFRYFAEQFVAEAKVAVERQTRNPAYARDSEYTITNKHWGLNTHFDDLDVRNITTAEFSAFMRSVVTKKPDISQSILTALTSTFRNVMKIAVERSVILTVPQTPKPKVGKSTPRPFFRFRPLVSKDEDQYLKLLAGLRKLEKEQVKVRGVLVTKEIYDLVVFLTNSFLRPTYTELYALRHADVTVSEMPKSLMLTVRKGKTGYRVANTMETCVDVYERICQRFKEANDNKNPTGEDYVFFPKLKRTHARRVAQNQLNEALKVAGLKIDPFTGQKHTMYSLRHTAICMRLVLSKGQINPYTLAKNAGTSVEIIEQHYAKNLPLSENLVRNLQSFGLPG